MIKLLVLSCQSMALRAPVLRLAVSWLAAGTHLASMLEHQRAAVALRMRSPQLFPFFKVRG